MPHLETAMTSFESLAIVEIDADSRIARVVQAGARWHEQRPAGLVGSKLADAARSRGARSVPLPGMRRGVLLVLADAAGACGDDAGRFDPVGGGDGDPALPARGELARLAHDLRTPLNAMAGWVHLLGSPHDAAAEMRERALDGLRRAIEQQRELVEALDACLSRRR